MNSFNPIIMEKITKQPEEEQEKIYCSECKEHSMIEIGNVYECKNEGCKNWYYTSS